MMPTGLCDKLVNGSLTAGTPAMKPAEEAGHSEGHSGHEPDAAAE